jgi:hypothetical protein
MRQQSVHFGAIRHRAKMSERRAKTDLLREAPPTGW